MLGLLWFALCASALASEVVLKVAEQVRGQVLETK